MSNFLRVLVVEDDEEDAELLRLELERGGRSVIMQRVDTEEAYLTALADGAWDVIISDYSMPTFDGLKAFSIYQETALDIPFIFVSGALGEDRAVKAMLAGARDYILKGNLGRLNAAVDREVAEAKSRRERKMAEAANRREQRRLAVALHATGAGVFEYRIPDDGKGYCSGRLAEILGCTTQELQGFDTFSEWILEHVHPQDLERVRQCHKNVTQGEEPDYAIEFRLRGPDGTWRDLWCLAEAAEHDSSGKVADLVGVILDQTDQRRMEDQFRQAQKMEAVGRLAGGVAHDFNNLLTVILNFGDFVMESLEPGSAAQEDMQEILNAARRAENLTNQLLSFSRRQPVDPTVLNVNDLLANLDKMLGRLLGEDIDITAELAPDLWNVRVDNGRLEQVVVNLAINARDAMPAGGTLRVRTRNVDFECGEESPESSQIISGQKIEIAVMDDGCGMDEEARSRLFEPFFTTKEPGKGTGLGLATCYGIVKQAGGVILVDSQPGVGTTVKVLLPRHNAPPAQPVKPETRQTKVRGDEVILVVEDEMSVRKLLTRVLGQLGYTVFEAANGVEALEIARTSKKRVRLVLTDVVMPKMSGTELVEKLIAQFPEMKVLLMSGYTGSEFTPMDGTAILQKPFSQQMLAERLREVLGEGQPV